VTAAQIAVDGLIAQKPQIVLIPGTTRRESIEEKHRSNQSKTYAGQHPPDRQRDEEGKTCGRAMHANLSCPADRTSSFQDAEEHPSENREIRIQYTKRKLSQHSGISRFDLDVHSARA
jgi:hypothetical protein